MIDPYPLLMAQSLVGTSLVLAGFGKVFASSPGSERLPTAVLLVVSTCEVVLGGCLLAHVASPAASLMALIVYLMFLCYTTIAVMKGFSGNCGCFGDLVAERWGLRVLARNGVLTALSALVFGGVIITPNTNPEPWTLLMAAASAVVIVVVYLLIINTIQLTESSEGGSVQLRSRKQ